MRSSFTSDTGLRLTRTPSARQLTLRRRLTAATIVLPAADVGRTVSVDRVTGASRLDPPPGDNPGDSVEESAWKRVR